MFFTSLITPIILLVLYSTFLKMYTMIPFILLCPENFTIPDKLINGFVGSQIISSILAVSCVTVSFCANLLMVQDKANGTIKDLTTTPLKRSSLAMSYYFATLISTLIICITATGFCLAYVAGTGWYMSALDIFYLILDVIMLVMFGYGIVKYHQLFPEYTRPNVRSRHNCKFGIRIYLRCIYADISVFGRTSENHFIFTRNLRNIAYPKPRHAGNI